jgi:hypothetical protein
MSLILKRPPDEGYSYSNRGFTTDCIMKLDVSLMDWILVSVLAFLLIGVIFQQILINRMRKRNEQLEQATSHLAIALESLNTERKNTTEEDDRSRAAIIGGIAGGGLGAIWGPVGVIAGSGIGSGIGNLAPDALEKAKSVVGTLKGGGNQSEADGQKKGFLRKIIPFNK